MPWLCRYPHPGTDNDVSKDVAAEMGLLGDRSPWRILVSCAAGHLNAFESWQAQGTRDGAAIYGLGLTEKDRLAASSAAYLAPDKQLERAIARAQAVLGAASVVGTIFTGFGLVGADKVKSASLSARLLVAVAVGALAIAAGLALWSLRLERQDIDVADANSLWKSFDDIVTRRWRWAKWSTDVFVVALVVSFAGAILLLFS